MSSLADIQQALINADAAGDTAAATQLAAHIRYLQDPNGGNYQPPPAAAPVAAPVAPDPSAGAQNLFLGGKDTGVTMPEWLSRGLIGAGKAVSDAGTGIAQAVGMGPSAQAVDETNRLDAPLMNTTAGALGDLAGNVGMMVLPAAGIGKAAELAGMARTASAAGTFVNPGTLQGAAAVGALQGAAQPVGTGDSRVLNTGIGALGGAAGQAVARGVGMIAQPVQNALSAGGAKAVQVLQDAGVPLDAAQQSGSAVLGKLKTLLGDNPFTRGAQDKLSGQQAEAFNTAVLKTIGEDAPAATPAVMSAAKDRIGQVFDDVAARNPVPFDNTLQTHLAQIEHDAAGVLNDTQIGPIKKQLDQIVTKAANNGGAIDGAAYQNLKQNLDRLSAGGDSTVGEFARDIRFSLDSALQRGTQASGNQADYQALLQARQQWGNLRKIEGTIDKLGNGDISPARLASVLGQKANRSSSVYGAGNQDLVELAQAGNQLLRDRTPNSGTAGRLAIQALPGLAVAGADYLHSGDAKSAAELGLGAWVLPRAASAALNNPRVANYLANGITPGATRTLLSAPAANPYLNAFVRGAPFALGAPAVEAQTQNYLNGQQQ